MSIDYNKEDHQDLSPSNILANIDIVNTKMNNKETAMVNINEVTDSKIEIKPKPQNVAKSEEDPLIDYIHSSRNITSICQLNNGTIVSCSNDKSIIIGEHIINNSHDDWIIKVISLPNNRIASCSWDETIKIWTLSSDIPFKVLKGHQDKINSILYVKEKDILISGSLDTLFCISIYNILFGYINYFFSA